MKIQNMFQKDIDRDINGVIKVSQDDQESLKQELSEYIITKDLRRCFDTFFDVSAAGGARGRFPTSHARRSHNPKL